MVRQVNIEREQLIEHLRRLKEFVDSWPAWKLETRASQYPRPSKKEASGGKWTQEGKDVVWGGDTPRCVSADKYNDATEIVTRHNADIVALTARAEAAEAERDELRRRLEVIEAMSKAGWQLHVEGRDHE